jgi:hypothetical protein
MQFTGAEELPIRAANCYTWKAYGMVRTPQRDAFVTVGGNCA